MANEKAPYTRDETADALNLVVNAVQDCERHYHDAFVQKVEARYDAYRGLVSYGEDRRYEEDEDWHSDVTAPYVLHTVEGMLATMLEPKPRFDIKPRPRPEEPIEAVMERVGRSDVLEATLDYALARDFFAQKQRPFMQQDLIAGITVFKDYWRYERRKVTSLVRSDVEIKNDYGEVVDSLTVPEEETSEQTIWDDACCEVRDVRDFFWPRQAVSVDKAEYLIDRTWESYEACKRKGKQGYYDNVEKLLETRGVATAQQVTQREMRLRNIDRTKDLVEILEYWTPERVITVGNRSVVLKDRPNPLWWGRMPFTVCSALPDGFQIPGISVVEALAQLQEMLWTLQNQRIDVLRLLANLITVIRSDVDDPDAFEWAPNAQWFVEDPQQVSTLPIDPTAAQITLQAEALIKGDIQSILGGLPYGGGAEQQSMDQETATGVSIITSIAQRLIQARKQHYLWAYAGLGKNFLLLYQQFLRDDRTIAILGPGGAATFKTVSPFDLQGDFDVMIDVTSDSLLRQERRAEAQALMQMSAQIAPVMAQSGSPLNLGTIYRKLLDAYDVPEKESFFMPGMPPGAAPGGLPGTAPVAEPNGAGVTNPGLAAGPSSPSNENSMSPEASMARLMSMRGVSPDGG